MGILIFIIAILFFTEWLAPVILLSIPAYWIFRALTGDTDAIVGLAIIALVFFPFTSIFKKYYKQQK